MTTAQLTIASSLGVLLWFAMLIPVYLFDKYFLILSECCHATLTTQSTLSCQSGG